MRKDELKLMLVSDILNHGVLVDPEIFYVVKEFKDNSCLCIEKECIEGIEGDVSDCTSIDCIDMYRYCQEIPEEEYEPMCGDDLPNVFMLVRYINRKSDKHLVTGRHEDRISYTCSDGYTACVKLDSLFVNNELEWSTDGVTWHKFRKKA